MNKKKQILNFFKQQNKAYNSYEAHKRVNKLIEVSKVHFERLLRKLYTEGKIYRTKTQVRKGYLYSISERIINEEYQKHILPYEFPNRKKLIKKLCLKNFSQEESSEKIFSLYTDLNCSKEFTSCLFAFTIGDGHIRKDEEELQFYFRLKKDAIKFKNKFTKEFPNIRAKVRYGHRVYVCSICNKNLARKLVKLGSPRGRKLNQEFRIPLWIRNGPISVQKTFLSTIIGNEGSKPQDNRWRIQFVLSKEKEHVESLIDLLNDIRSLLRKFSITTSHIQLRTQPGRNFHGRFYIKGKENIYKFHDLFHFAYASEKQEVLESLILNDSGNAQAQ